MALHNVPLSKRALAIQSPSIQQDLLASWITDGYDKTQNPDGIINLGSSLNTITTDLMEDFIRQNHQLSSEKAISPNRLRGSVALCQCFADFFNRHFAPRQRVSPADVFCANGLSALIDAMMFALFDEHEAILMPTPGFELLSHAIEMRSSIRCVFADTEHLKDQFASASIPELLAAFEDSVNEALTQGLTVRAIFLCNPHNPLGRCYEPSVLSAIMAFCETRGLHLVVDEIYALSASEGRFHSTLTVSGTAATNVHVLYGPGKDWGLCGARLGCLITRNHELLRTLEQTARFTRASSLAEELLLSIFSDHDYTDSVHIPALRKRLSLARAGVMQRLAELEIPFVEPHASFGIWINLQRYLRFFCQNSSESREAKLAKYLLSRGVLLMPSDAFHTNDRGAFRLNYAVDAEMLRNGMDRFERALGELKGTHSPRAKRLSK